MKVNQTQNPRSSGVNATRRALVQVIKLACSIDLQHESRILFRIYDKWIQDEGIRSATLRLKNIYHTVLNHSLGQVPPQYPFIATTRGFPRIVLFLEKYCTSPEGTQAVLSLLGYWRGVRCPGTPNLESITAPMKTEYPSRIENLIVKEIPNKWKFNPNELSPVKHHFSSRQGPNGQRLLFALSDFKALSKDPILIESIDSILTISESLDFQDYWEDLKSEVDIKKIPNEGVHSRLSVKQELGGKDRVFALFDYFSQCVLRPLHQKIASILRTIDQDSTWNQDKGAEKVKTWTGQFNDLYSYDLTAATDRVPARLQKAVLETLTGSSDFADAWLNLMTNRSFKFRKREIRYSVGQPMGAYSSWPMFALTHHLIVRVSAKMVKISHPEYVLLGDDIVIHSKSLAASYLRNMQALGVEISMSKTVTGKVAEFAKRLFTQGGEISAIPVKLIQRTLRDYRLITTLYQRLVTNVFGTKDRLSVQSALSDWAIQIFSDRTAHRARILLSVPSQESEGLHALLKLTGNTGLSHNSPSFEEWTMLLALIKYNYLIQRYRVEMKRIIYSGITDKDRVSAMVKPYLSTIERVGLDTTNLDLHPLNHAAQEAILAAGMAHRALGKYWTALTRQGLRAEMPSVNLPNMRDLNSSYLKRLKQEATIQLSAVELFSEFCKWKLNHPDHSVLEFLKNRKERGPTQA